MNSRLTIYKRGTTDQVRFVAPIAKGSVLKFTLDKEDYIKIRFSASTQIAFELGDYVLTSGLTGLSGYVASRYVLIEANNPTYNEATGGYQYELRLDAWYWQLNEYKFMLPYRKADGTYYRKELNFSLTDSIEAHLRLWMLNARNIMIGLQSTNSVSVLIEVSPRERMSISWNSAQNDYTISHTGSSTTDVYFANDPKFVEYNAVNMIDALNNICNTWGCEWWLDGSVLHIGRCEKTNNPYNITNGENASVKSSGSAGKVATRLYAYGSARNLAASYRKELILHAGYNRTSNNEITDPIRPLKVSMFKSVQTKAPDVVSVARNGELDLKSILVSGSTWDDAYITNLGYEEGFAFRTVSLKSGSRNLSARLSQRGKSIEADYTKSVEGVKMAFTGVVRMFWMEQITRAQLSTIDSLETDVTLYVIDADGHRTDIGTQTCQLAEAESPIYYNEGGGAEYHAFWWDLNLNIEIDSGQISAYARRIGVELSPATVKIGSYVAKVYSDWLTSNAKITVSYPYQSASFRVTVNGTSRNAVINPDFAPYNTKAGTRVIITPSISIANGTAYTINPADIYSSRVPGEYYSEPETSMTKNAVSDVRLMLPVGTDYVDAVDDAGNTVITSQNDVIEAVEYFDDIYPQREDTCAEIRTKAYSKERTDEVTGTPIREQFEAYQFVASKASNDFSRDYIVKNGEGLFITFNSGSLAGMTFEVAWNPTHAGEAYQAETMADGTRNPNAKWFEIIANTEYGRLLPDDTLKPSVNDKFVMYGYDTSYIGDSMITSAENDLLIRAKAHLQKQLHSDRTYTIALFPKFATTTKPKLGERVKMATPNYFIKNRIERVLGYEICLDIPTDNPKFTVGEMAVYSRLASIENKLRGN